MIRRGRPPLAHAVAYREVLRCVVATSRMLRARTIHQPDDHLGRRLEFADGTSAPVYRETVVDREVVDNACVLVVKFRLRWVRGRLHRWFRVESLLNTPLFVGFPGFVSKLWLAHDAAGVYRGVYEWDGPDRAEHYARCLWRVLALVSVPGSIDYVVITGCRRDDALRDPARIGGGLPEDHTAWWRPRSPGMAEAGAVRESRGPG